MDKTEMERSTERVGVVAGCIIRENDKYLLVQEKQPHDYGLWCLPVGHVDKGEEIDVAAIREVKEETGLDVRLIKEVALYHEKATKNVKHIFSAEVTGGSLTPQEDEILDAKWLSFDEIQNLNTEGKIRRPWVWDAIRKDHSLLS